MQVLSRGSPGYPDSLLALKKPPDQLYLRGEVGLLGRPAVAVVGARRASEKGRRLAESWCRQWAQAGVVVISGGALGIDAAAHRGALAGEGATVVVLPTPVDQPAPRTNLVLFERILASGAGLLLSENQEIRGKAAFAQRNRLIAALSEVVVLLEASATSGTAHTLRAARQLGRPIAAVPWFPAGPQAPGSMAALRSGAAVLTEPEDLYQWVRPGALPLKKAVAPHVVLAADSLANRILQVLIRGPAGVDSLQNQLGVPVEHLFAQLTELELSGRLRVLAGGRYEVS